jgi:hypothetical protein
VLFTSQLLKARDGYNIDDTLTIQGFDEMMNEPFPDGRKANNFRDQFANYFLSPDEEVPWQYKKF